MDEKGVQLGGGRHNSQEKLFYSQTDKMMYKQKGDSLKLVTIIDCVCADGTAPIRLAFVFAGATKFDNWFEVDNEILCVFRSNGDLHGIDDILSRVLILRMDGQTMRLGLSGSKNVLYLRLKHKTSQGNQLF